MNEALLSEARILVSTKVNTSPNTYLYEHRGTTKPYALDREEYVLINLIP